MFARHYIIAYLCTIKFEMPRQHFKGDKAAKQGGMSRCRNRRADHLYFMSNNNLSAIESNPQTLVMLTAGDLCELVERLIEAKTKKEQPTEQGDEYLSSAQLKSLFGVTSSTIWRWKQAGLIRPVKFGGIMRYRKDEIMGMLNDKV